MELTRRAFAGGSGALSAAAIVPGAGRAVRQGHVPWYQTAYRWAQTNTSLQDVATYDVEFWRRQLKRTGAQVVIANGVAGFACFPSRNPLVISSPFAPDRDLLGEIAAAARADGIHVCARMDSGVLNPKIIAAYPDWRTRDANGRPGNAMCINSPYREHHVYPLFEEIVDRYRVAAFTDNAGVNGGPLCHCGYCGARFAREVGGAIPTFPDMEDARYRVWRRWNAAVTMAAWEQTNSVTRQIGGPDCLYIGLVRKFAPLNREVARRAGLLLMDCQSRNDAASFHEHVDDGRFMHSLVGWDRNVAVASSMTHHSHGYFRLTSEPVAEVSLYTLAGTAGGFSPWWHHPTAASADRRSYQLAPPLFQTAVRREAYIRGGVPVVTAGLAYSDANASFFGRDAPPLYQPGLVSEVTQTPYRGMSRALFNQGVPYTPFHLLDLERHSADLPAIVLPNLGGLSDAECAAIRAYVRRGGGIVATGATSLYDEDGEPRSDFALADVFGVRIAGPVPSRRFFDLARAESYLRVDGEPNHPALEYFAPGALIGYGGTALPIAVGSNRTVLATLVPANSHEQFAVAPGRLAAVVVGRYGRGRVAYLPIDLDRRYLRDPHPDQARLLAGLVLWSSGRPAPLRIDGPGRVGGWLYRQGDRLVLHLLNGSGIDDGDEMTGEVFPVGQLRVKVRQLPSTRGIVRLLNGSSFVRLRARRVDEMMEFDVSSIGTYQLILVE